MGGDYANDEFWNETLISFQLKALHKNSCFTKCQNCLAYLYRY